jgi:hypothetical protein
MPPDGTGREIVVVPGADHGLKRGLQTIADAVVTWMSRLA